MPYEKALRKFENGSLANSLVDDIGRVFTDQHSLGLAILLTSQYAIELKSIFFVVVDLDSHTSVHLESLCNGHAVLTTNSACSRLKSSCPGTFSIANRSCAINGPG